MGCVLCIIGECGLNLPHCNTPEVKKRVTVRPMFVYIFVYFVKYIKNGLQFLSKKKEGIVENTCYFGLIFSPPL